MSTPITSSKSQSESYDIFDTSSKTLSIETTKKLKEKLIRELGFVDQNGFQNPNSKCLFLETFDDPEVPVDRQGRVSALMIYPDFIHIEVSTIKRLYEEPRSNQRGGIRFKMFYEDSTVSLQRIFENIEYLANSIKG